MTMRLPQGCSVSATVPIDIIGEKIEKYSEVLGNYLQFCQDRLPRLFSETKIYFAEEISTFFTDAINHIKKESLSGQLKESILEYCPTCLSHQPKIDIIHNYKNFCYLPKNILYHSFFHMNEDIDISEKFLRLHDQYFGSEINSKIKLILNFPTSVRQVILTSGIIKRAAYYSENWFEANFVFLMILAKEDKFDKEFLEKTINEMYTQYWKDKDVNLVDTSFIKKVVLHLTNPK